ncbi:MAG: hypothetical protein L0Y72_21235 [Gemmataceae bacterium]|nr:hypothetical protein [Gemmataceae bacterium]MCI0741567.1 hypothetical protein [Gemmataceae bacterium]
MANLTIDPHPLLDASVFVTKFPRPLGEMPTPPEVLTLFSLAAVAPLTSNDEVREKVRALLRYGGFKPTGRSKPSAEYLIRAVGDMTSLAPAGRGVGGEGGKLSSINLAVDVCNAVSLHSGLPISVIDLDRAQAPFRIGIAPAGAAYVFNSSGQSIDLAGLLCLFDAEGPCANGVKDAQRTKTSEGTLRTLSVIWGTNALPGRAEQTCQWYRELLAQCHAQTSA